ncbi:MAG: hypothetical protein AAB614_01070 [Patescibacteria group bacterium]
MIEKDDDLGFAVEAEDELVVSEEWDDLDDESLSEVELDKEDF